MKELKELTISDVVSSKEFYDELNAIVEELRQSRRTARQTMGRTLGSHVIESFLKADEWHTDRIIALFQKVLCRQLEGYSASQRKFIYDCGMEAFSKVMKLKMRNATETKL